MTLAPVQDDTTRERLVRAAAEVFAERGYEGSRVQEIARRAGLTTGAIYGNFRNKAELLLEAIGTAPIDALFAEHRAGLSTVETLRRAGHRLVTADPDRRTLLFEAFVAARRDPDVALVLRQRITERRAQLEELIADGRVERGLAPHLDTEALAHFCHALALGFLVADAAGLPRPDSKAWSTLIDVVVASLTAGTGGTSDDNQ